MDNTAQNQAQTVPVASQPSQPVTPVAQPQAESITQPVALDQPQTQVQATPIAPVSLPHREAGPGLGRMNELMMPSEVAPVLSAEVKAAGVEVSADREQPVVPADVAQAGVQPAKAAVPMHTVTGSNVQYITNAPFGPEEAIKFEKSTRASDSIRWLATFLLRQVKKVAIFGK